VTEKEYTLFINEPVSIFRHWLLFDLFCMATMKQPSSFPVLPFVLGASLGGVAGLLLTPYPGKVARQKLAQQARIVPQQLAGQVRGEKGQQLLKVSVSALQTALSERSGALSLLIKGIGLLRKAL
jgi:hypothetical protein